MSHNNCLCLCIFVERINNREQNSAFINNVVQSIILLNAIEKAKSKQGLLMIFMVCFEIRVSCCISPQTPNSILFPFGGNRTKLWDTEEMLVMDSLMTAWGNHV